MNQFAKPGLAEEKLPPVGTSDNGKVLGVSDGAWDKIAAPSGLPEIGAGDTGKVLTATADGAAWQSGGSSGGGVLVVTSNDGTLNKTWQEIATASDTSIVALLYKAAHEMSVNYLVSMWDEDGEYCVQFLDVSTPAVNFLIFATDSQSGYPTFQSDGNNS